MDYHKVVENLHQTIIDLYQDHRIDKACQICYHLLSVDPQNLLCIQYLPIFLGLTHHSHHAIIWCQRGLQLDPFQAELRNNYSKILSSLNNLDHALSENTKSIILEPNSVDYFIQRASITLTNNDHNLAIKNFLKARTIDPYSPDIYKNLSIIYHGLKQNSAGEKFARYPLLLCPQEPDYYYHISLFIDLNKNTLFAHFLETRLLLLASSREETFNQIAHISIEAGDLTNAIILFKSALVQRPSIKRAWFNFANHLYVLGHSKQAYQTMKQFLRLSPYSVEGHNNFGTILQSLGNFDQTELSYKKGIILDPNNPASHFYYGQIRLCHGDFLVGWKKYEWRGDNESLGYVLKTYSQPQWRGEAGYGRTILIHAEQGMGDTLQFCRYIPLVQEKGWKVILEVPDSLVRLMGSLSSVEKIIASGDPLPDFDVQCRLLSLPLAFETKTNTIPNQYPYLFPDSEEKSYWKKKLTENYPDKPRIGLVWAGNPRTKNGVRNPTDLRRSLTFQQVQPLLDSFDAYFFLLSPDNPCHDSRIIDFTEDFFDYSDTAAFITSLDLIVSVDTSIIHLAGALGIPVWMIDRIGHCWRWIAGQEKSQWYPLMKIFRQNIPDDWDTVIQKICKSLQTEVIQKDPMRDDPIDYDREIKLDDVQCLLKQALYHFHLNNMPLAKKIAEKIVRVNPQHSENLLLLGIISAQTGQKEEALYYFNSSLKIDPYNAQTHFNLCNLYLNLENYELAEISGRKAILLSPSSNEALKNTALATHKQHKLPETITIQKKIVSMTPYDSQLHRELGIQLKHNQNHVLSFLTLLHAVVIDPDSALCWNDFSYCLIKEHDPVAEKIKFYRRSILLDPERPKAHFNLSLELLKKGLFREGWTEYERRWDVGQLYDIKKNIDIPLWDGRHNSDHNGIIYIISEQGFGDTLQFCRLIPLVAERGWTVILCAPEPLHRLLKSIKEINSLHSEIHPPEDTRFICLLLSLPYILKIELNTIPAKIPYLKIESSLVSFWHSKIESMLNKKQQNNLKVGLVWSGKRRENRAELIAVDQLRSIKFSQLEPLFRCPNVTFFNLQKDTTLDLSPFSIINLMKDCEDFNDTGALISCLDLVISVDTAILHLTGAIGKPIWLLDRFDNCWRWLDNRDDSPWYPTLKIFRQPKPGDWQSVIEKIQRALLEQIKLKKN